jgi:small subunit ribosomal protein S15
MLTKDQKSEIVQKFGGKTGSPEVQVALMTARINYLTGHFADHKLDHHSKRGLMKLIGRRRRMLRYLNNVDETRYKKLITDLGLRK